MITGNVQTRAHTHRTSYRKGWPHCRERVAHGIDRYWFEARRGNSVKASGVRTNTPFVA